MCNNQLSFVAGFREPLLDGGHQYDKLMTFNVDTKFYPQS